MGMVGGKIAIITGATSGISRAPRRAVRAAGAKVVVSGRRQAEGATVAARLGRKAKFIQADATCENDWTDRATFSNATDIVVDAGPIGGAMFTPHHEGLKQVRARFGI